jgi:hypothetical protein
MPNMDNLLSLAGNWRGENLLWISLDEEPHESRTTAAVTTTVRGKFVRLDYGWSFEDEPQEGSLLIGQSEETGKLTAIWVDSWHMNDKIMICQGEIEENGSANLRGAYSAQSGPDWGWRIVIEPGGIDSFRVFMYNITPQGVEALAVEADYRLVREEIST